MFFCLRRILVDAYVDAKQDSLVRSAAVFIDRYNLLVPPSKCWRHATVRTDRCQSQMLVRNRDFHLPHLHWTSMLRRFSSEYCHKVLFGKTVTIQTWKKNLKIYLLVSTECTNVTDRRTDRHRTTVWSRLGISHDKYHPILMKFGTQQQI